ncbi:MAG: cell division protein ZapA [Alphaproteobacteria bacterium]|jgi:cell division protein ZapA|nr:cell division protein ZapA [Rhodospirillaceae bacterium]MDG2479504.1 cell division protein ZapA [Alphaproteobacteria bacterium]MBT6206301.1 cell division protein ZapA [Rhodospirillaceae bacterium]MBT6508958.1 cell division protein ZapA [Rhodospirillaceae bacterium]MBT7612627.1 cell division protein ZapA [Rhodospirillaceae bacterium]
MAQVNVQIHGRSYQVACGDGEEERIAGLASYVDSKVQELVGALGNVGDQRLLVMVSLLLADELWEQREGGTPKAGGPKADNGSGKRASSIEALAERLDKLAERLEAS